MNQLYNSKFDRPNHERDDGHAHINFGEDPKPNLQKYGYCVVENVFTQKECSETINEIWDWLEGLGTGIKRNDKTTWNNNNWPHCVKQGMIQHTLGQAEFMWKVREHINIIYLFYQIYNTFNLLVSFDAAMFGRPPETSYVQAPTQSWLHTDQNIVKNIKPKNVYKTKHYCIQGVANFEDSGDLDGSLFIGEGSHLLHSALFKKNGKTPSGNWYMIDKKDLDFLIDKNIKFYKVNAPKGSMILFDSRAIHSGYPSQKGRDVEKFRYVVYVSMTPANRASQKDLDKKKKAIQEGRTTTHWSSNNIKLFGKPQLYGKEFAYMSRKENIPDYQNWSDCRKKLAGLLSY
ncbi:phytanoyl-CoA dioxygenase [Fadolivirus algeromassiliense]|jgi:hypothetical protein|uniref:Phytanoyl-CoA dioxygenase n=1 Tax=Fadolivirus FV1/VV64 TaxID=3070911 RepID=A0A7D3UUX6_9VIRU|nr:phytanoyl-CoA dioxygenase [Fadolivirus algeromassiliense]QKF93554.1 phytanoyl-CoA dioxygenase [Fadolivirus FV1/VV64]